MQRQQRLKLSNWDCEYQLFRKELEDADDLRLSVRMFHACLADKKQFCDDVPAGIAGNKSIFSTFREYKLCTSSLLTACLRA
jgi:Golgi apparatus protein 1